MLVRIISVHIHRFYAFDKVSNIKSNAILKGPARDCTWTYFGRRWRNVNFLPKLFRCERGGRVQERVSVIPCANTLVHDMLDLELFILGPHFFSLARVQVCFRIQRDGIRHKLGSSALI